LTSGRFAQAGQLSLRCLLDDADFLVGQAVELEDELVDLSVGGFDLALDERFLVVGLVNYIRLQGQAPFVLVASLIGSLHYRLGGVRFHNLTYRNSTLR